MNRRSFLSLFPKAIVGAKLAPLAALAAPPVRYWIGIDRALLGSEYTTITILKGRQIGMTQLSRATFMHRHDFCPYSSADDERSPPKRKADGSNPSRGTKFGVVEESGRPRLSV